MAVTDFQNTLREPRKLAGFLTGRFATCVGLLIVCGMLWGLMPSLSKLAGLKEQGLAGAISLSLWVNIIGAATVLFFSTLNSKMRKPTPVELHFYLKWALLYSLMNQVLIYWVSQHLSVSLVSIITALEGFVIFAVASTYKMEVLNWKRFGGLILGALGVALLMASEFAGQPSIPLFWLAVTLVIPLTYAGESLLIAQRPTSTDPITSVGFVMLMSAPMLFAASVTLSGEQALVLPDRQLLLVATPIVVANLVANISYFVLISKGGAVCAGQCSNFITLFGVLWGILLLGEKATGNLALSLCLIFAGLTIVGVKSDNPVVKHFASKLPQRRRIGHPPPEIRARRILAWHRQQIATLHRTETKKQAPPPETPILSGLLRLTYEKIKSSALS